MQWEVVSKAGYSSLKYPVLQLKRIDGIEIDNIPDGLPVIIGKGLADRLNITGGIEREIYLDYISEIDHNTRFIRYKLRLDGTFPGNIPGYFACPGIRTCIDKNV
jgi:hypothetical protein